MDYGGDFKGELNKGDNGSKSLCKDIQYKDIFIHKPVTKIEGDEDKLTTNKTYVEIRKSRS